MSYSLNSLNGGYVGDYIGDYYRGYRFHKDPIWGFPKIRGVPFWGSP